MTLRQVLECAQPLFFDDGPEGYEYSCGGTFFFAKFSNRFFAITAKHCLNDRYFPAIRLLRPSPSKERAFIPVEVVSVIEEPEESPCDWADLVFIRVNESVLSAADQKATWFLDCDTLSRLRTNFAMGDGLGTKGYPYFAKGIDYDNGVIKIGAVAWSGEYAGPADRANIHKFKFSELIGVPELNGFSGSPVFKIFQKHGITAYWFAGVIIQGSVESRVAHFVGANVVFQALTVLCGRE